MCDHEIIIVAQMPVVKHIGGLGQSPSQIVRTKCKILEDAAADSSAPGI